MLDWSPAPAPASCALYLFTSQFTATLHSATVLLLVWVTYRAPAPSPGSGSGSGVLVQSSVTLLATLLTASALLCSPSLALASLDQPSHACNLTFSDQRVLNQSLLLFYNSGLPYLLPITAVMLPLVRLMRRMNTAEDREGSVTITVVIVTSYIVFYTPYAALIFVKDLLGLGLFPVTPHSAWIVKIMQSLFLMITFFFHVFRPLASFLLDPELDLSVKKTHYHVPVPVLKI